MSDALRTLNGTRDTVWQTLTRGATDKSSPASTPVLATASDQNGASARIVVLRSADPVSNTLTFFAHSGSQKAVDLNEDERAEVLIWCPETQLQIRLKVTVAIDDIDPETWSKQGAGTRLNYATNPSPGTRINRPELALQATPDQHMMVRLLASVDRIETLWIAPDGLRRAVFEDGQSQWIAP